MKETQEHSRIEDFAQEFRAMVTENEPSLLYDEGIMLTVGDYEVHIFAETREDANNEALVQLVDQRMDLLRGSLMAQGFQEFVSNTFDLADWLGQRGLQVGLGANTWWAHFRLRLLKWFPAIFGV